MARPEERRLKKIDIPTLLDEKAALRERIIGQDEAVEAFATLYAKLKSGIRRQQPGPFDIKFLAGPSGVGKTEMIYALADLIAIGDKNPRSKVIKINAAEYQHDHMLSRILGSPPGYRGSEDPLIPGSGSSTVFSQENLNANTIVYTDHAGNQRKIVIVLVDEAEKAHEALHRAFLSVLDKGEMELSSNKTVDFSNALIFYTSNVGNELVEDLRDEGDGSLDGERVREMVSDAFRAAFPPEFRGRIKDLIIFKHLDEEAIRTIAGLKLKKVENDFAHNGISIELELSGTALDWIIAQGYNPSEGARALDKIIERFLHDKLTLAHVSMDINGRKIYIDIEEGELEPSFFYDEQDRVKEVKPIEPEPISPTPSSTQTSVVDSETKPQSSKQDPVQPEGERAATAMVQPAIKPHAEARVDERVDPQPIPRSIKSRLTQQFRTWDVDHYVMARDEFVRAGVITAEDANALPEIKKIAANKLSQQMRVWGLENYVIVRDQLVRAGIFTKAQCDNWDVIKGMAKSSLEQQYRVWGIDNFVILRDSLVRAGIGTVEEWNALIT